MRCDGHLFRIHASRYIEHHQRTKNHQDHVEEDEENAARALRDAMLTGIPHRYCENIQLVFDSQRLKTAISENNSSENACAFWYFRSLKI